MRNATRAGVSLLAGALMVSGCMDITTPDYNRPGVPDLTEAPNATIVNAATVGLVGTSRTDATNYVRYLGILGREAYYLDQNESRYVTELVTGRTDPSAFSGGGLWGQRYATIRQGFLILDAVDKVNPNELTTAQRNGIKGYTKTIQGLEYMLVANVRVLAPVDVNIDVRADPAPLVNRAAVYARSAAILDDAATNLRAGGATFSFASTSGFTQYGFNTPAQVLKFNRALRARLAVQTGDYATAYRILSAADSTFMTMPATPTRDDFNRGVYYNFSAASGDLVNGLTNPAPQVADTILRHDVARRVGGTGADTVDLRYSIKVAPKAVRTQLGISSNLGFVHYNTRPFFGPGGSASPIPIIRNEELLLLRAEAAWKTGRLPEAITVLNYVRVNSGGLTARTDLTDANFLNALLYERRYSLLYEGGWRYLDLRRFGLLNDPAYKVKDYPRTGDMAPDGLPIPFAECLARGIGSQGC